MLAGRAPATGDGDGEDLRPGAPEWRQAVDDHYASLADALETMDPDERARFEDDYARATGVLPGAVEKRLRGGLLSADPAEQAAAAQRIVRLQDGNPASVSNIPAVERRRAQDIAEFVDLGLPPERAVELAKKKLAQRVLPTEDHTGGVGDDTLTAGDTVDDTLTGGFGHDTLIGDVRVGSEEGIPVVAPGAKGRGEDDTAAGEETEPTAGAEEQAVPGATRGERPDQSRRSVEDLRRLYRDRDIPDDVARTLAKTGVVPQVEQNLDGKKVELIRAVRDLDPEDEKAVKALRKRIRDEVGHLTGVGTAFDREVLARVLQGRKPQESVEALAFFAARNFGREIDPENAELLAAVLEATPKSQKDVLGWINRRFGGIGRASAAYKRTLSGVIQFKQTGGKRGLSPEAAAERLMPHVDGSIDETKKQIAKTAIGAVALGPGLILELIGIINSAESLGSMSGTAKQRKRVRRRINEK